MNRSISRSLAVLVVASSALAAECPGTKSRGPADHTIVIALALNDADQWCRIKVEPPASAKCDSREWLPVAELAAKKEGSACVKKDTSLAWRSTKPFQVHFDPLERGRSLDALCKGDVCETHALKFNDKAPPLEHEQIVEYKYTILVDGCREPLDPGVFTQR